MENRKYIPLPAEPQGELTSQHLGGYLDNTIAWEHPRTPSLLSVAKIGEQPKYPGMGGEIKTIWSVYTIECEVFI